LNVTEAGNYTITGDLSGNRSISSATNSTYLGKGEHNVTLSFDGLTIRAFRYNGSYKLRVVEIVDQNYNQTDILENAYNTSSYLYTQFERPSAEFIGDFTDSGVDTDYDGLYNYLALKANVSVFSWAGPYSVSAHLLDSNFTEITSNRANYTPGIQTVSLTFDGILIADHGMDGPYRISALTLNDKNGT